jgi:hypothetical protein
MSESENYKNKRGFGARLKNLFFGNDREHKEHPARNLKPGEQGRTFMQRLRNVVSGYSGRNNSRQASTGNTTRKNSSGNNNATRKRRNSSNSSNSRNNNNSNGNNSIDIRNKAIVKRVEAALNKKETIELSQYEYEVIKAYRPDLKKEFTEKRQSNGRSYGSVPSKWVHESE